ncbi:hypothetical protein Droror1_Dr00013082 [Drosera rotundifolia]
MAKVAVYTIIATVIIIFLLSKKPHNERNRVFAGRRFGFRHLLFDPLMSKMERMAEEKGMLNNDSGITASSFLKNDKDAMFFDDQGKLNVTRRLMVLFPMIYNLTKDGLVDFKELEAWNIMQAGEKLDYRTRIQIRTYDKNGDGCISFKEYLPCFSDSDIEKNNLEHGEAGWWKEQFRNADVDRDEVLNFQEFRDFLHPEDGVNENVQRWLLQEKTRRMDLDRDQRLNFQEFRDAAYDTFRSYYEFRSVDAGGELPSPFQEFTVLDVDKDGYLAIQELKPIKQYLFPGELEYATYYATYLMNQADEDKDGKLTLDEMLNHEDMFYSTIYPQHENEDLGDDNHDEF